MRKEDEEVDKKWLHGVSLRSFRSFKYELMHEIYNNKLNKIIINYYLL